MRAGPPTSPDRPRSRLGRRAFGLGGALALAGCATRPPPAGPMQDAVTLRRELGPQGPYLALYQALDATARGRRQQPVTLLQIGDSHTANDAFSGRMRELFQQRFGAAGRGMMPPGIPHRWFRPAQVSVSATGWRTIHSFPHDEGGPFGLAGLRQRASFKASIEITASEADGVAEFRVEALGQPGGGSLEILAEGAAPLRVSTASTQGGALFFTLRSAPAANRVVLRTLGDGPVDLLGYRLGSGHPGVSYANFGTIGASVRLVNGWDDGLLAQEMQDVAPALILLAFGTNEGFDPGTSAASYAPDFTAALHRLRAAAPGASFAVLGAPDAVRALRRGASTAGACPPGKNPRIRYTEPPHLNELRQAQRDIAATEGVAFWDWSSAMGGACSMVEWAEAEPKLAGADHIHLMEAGYRRTAEALFADIMGGYEEYRRLTGAAGA